MRLEDLGFRVRRREGSRVRVRVRFPWDPMGPPHYDWGPWGPSAAGKALG